MNLIKDIYYAIELEDYSIPPFCSGFTRTYAGTKAHLADFMEALSKSRGAEDFQPLLDNAYRAWLRGEPVGAVEYHYCKCWNIRPLDVYRTAEISLPSFSMEHLNTWLCPYFFQADGVRAKVIYARDGESWYRFVQAAFRRLQYDSIPVKGFILGHPAMLELADGVISNRLFFQERELGDREAMLRDIASPAEIDFTDFMKDILGDG